MLSSWQDIVFSLGSIVFTMALVPAIIRKRYPPISTCVLTATMLIVYAVTDATLGLWFSTITTIASSIIWMVMGVKQINKN